MRPSGRSRSTRPRRFSHHFIGTDENEADSSATGAVTGPLGFGGAGGDDHGLRQRPGATGLAAAAAPTSCSAWAAMTRSRATLGSDLARWWQQHRYRPLWRRGDDRTDRDQLDGHRCRRHRHPDRRRDRRRQRGRQDPAGRPGGSATIQEAVDAAADGDTILIAPGTYSGNVTVNKDVTIRAPMPAFPATMAAADLERSSMAGSTSPPTASPSTASRITGARDRGRPPRPSGIYLAGDDFTLTNSMLDGDGVATNGGGDNGAILTEQVTGLDVGDNLFAAMSSASTFPAAAAPARSTTISSRAMAVRSPASATASTARPSASPSRTPSTASAAC